MDLITEMNAAIKLGLNEFKLFLEQKLRIDANYLERPFWIENGEQTTVLNYLIQRHQEKAEEIFVKKPSFDLTQYIDFVLGRVRDKNTGEPPLKLYAEFVRRYNDAYQNQRITNPWSSMRWMIAEGKCNWEMVKQYAHAHPGTRTQIIYNDMFKTLPKMEIHELIENTIGTLHSNAS